MARGPPGFCKSICFVAFIVLGSVDGFSVAGPIDSRADADRRDLAADIVHRPCAERGAAALDLAELCGLGRVSGLKHD